MKKRRFIIPAAGILLLLSTISISAQYVGEATPPEVVKTGTSQKLIEGFFTIKCGMFIPSDRNSFYPESVADINEGYVTMEQGIFAEVGRGMIIGRKKVGFYFYPFLIAAYMSGTDFKAAVESDTRDFTAAEIAQRYGVFYRPVKHLYVAGYYRPAALVPIGFNSGEFTGKLTFEKGFASKMMTHSIGLAVQYRFISMSYEYYIGKPLMEIYNNTTDETTFGQVPVRLNVISLAFNL